MTTEINQDATADAGRFLTAQWKWLAMLNYEIDPSVLSKRVPRGTEIDYWNGRCYVSMVGFLFLDTKVLGLPVPFHRDFEEVNLRFYVRRNADDGWRRGVSFIKEIVPKFAIAAVAQIVYNENYVSTPMRRDIETEENGELKKNGRVEYGWKWDDRWNSLSVRTAGDPQPMITGSEEEFIAEHYWGYSLQRDGGTVEYKVEHPKWRVWQVSEHSFDCDVEQLYGKEFVPFLSASPTSAFLAEGSLIAVYNGVRV